MMMSGRRKRILPGWAIIALDVLALGAALGVFALFDFVLPKAGGGPKLTIVNVGSGATAAPTATNGAAKPAAGTTPSEAASPGAAVTPASAATPAQGDFSASFPATDTGAGALQSYQTNDVRVAVTSHSENSITYYVADVYVKNISSLRTAFAKGQYGQGIHQDFMGMAQANKAVIAISGDYYGAHPKGVVVRNGQLYRDTPLADVCVLYADGVMETFAKDAFSLDDAVARGAYQIWSFGPQLLDNGQPMHTFNSSLQAANPRCAIGYYAPGHYCFVVVDGRQPGYSDGITMEALSQLFADLGCKAAYNLDGGQTAMMGFQGKLVNKPYNGGRSSSDIIYIAG